jgi:hypothetical protein
MSDNDDWFTFDPFVEELGIPWCIVIPTLSHAFIKLLGKVLTGGSKTLYIPYCLHYASFADMIALRCFDVNGKVWVG